MIDLHSHLLHGVDDGAVDIQESFELLKMAIDDGVSHIVLTPHIHIGRYDNTFDTLQKPFKELEYLIEENQLNIKISLGAEVRLCSGVFELLKDERFPFIGQWENKKVILLEFPHNDIPLGSEKLVDWLLGRNILPMIAHPERNRAIMNDIRKVVPFLQRNCLFQITAQSVTGKFGVQAHRVAHEFLLNNWVSVVASDAHNKNRRPPVLSEAYQVVNKQYGINLAQKLFLQNPSKILS